MNQRQRRPHVNKSFVSGGVYNAQPSPNNAPRKAQKQTPENVEPNQQELQKQQSQPQQWQQQEVQPQPEVQANPNKPDINSELFNESGKLQFKKIFMARKKSSVRAKEKKIRRNRQLRRVLFPRNALMALYEVKGIKISDFNINANPGGGFTAVVTVNEKPFEGKGISKINAKNAACENALRDYVLEKMRKYPRFPKVSQSGEEPMDTSDAKDDSEDCQEEEQPDDVPMINLASFAIYKLFSEWENEGFEVPELHPSAVAPANGKENGQEVKEPKKPPIRSELPPNWEAIHPATLLCMMRPGITYTDYGAVGEAPNILQRVGVVVDGQEFEGMGRAKKIARRNAAVSVCNSLFGTNFLKDEPCDTA